MAATSTVADYGARIKLAASTVFAQAWDAGRCAGGGTGKTYRNPKHYAENAEEAQRRPE